MLGRAIYRKSTCIHTADSHTRRAKTGTRGLDRRDSRWASARAMPRRRRPRHDTSSAAPHARGPRSGIAVPRRPDVTQPALRTIESESAQSPPRPRLNLQAAPRRRANDVPRIVRGKQHHSDLTCVRGRRGYDLRDGRRRQPTAGGLLATSLNAAGRPRWRSGRSRAAAASHGLSAPCAALALRRAPPPPSHSPSPRPRARWRRRCRCPAP